MGLTKELIAMIWKSHAMAALFLLSVVTLGTLRGNPQSRTNKQFKFSNFAEKKIASNCTGSGMTRAQM